MTTAQLIQLLLSAVSFGTVIMYGAIGEILTEKSGNLNLGVPGIMYLGGIGGLATSFFYELNNPSPNALICLLISFLGAFWAAALGGLLYSFLTITLRANQNVTGLTLTIFGSGVANFFGGDLSRMAGGVGQISVPVTSGIYRANLANSANLGVLGTFFFGYGFMVYLAILLAILLSLFLNRTRKGLNLRAVGENPATADAAGINVTRNKYLATSIGAGICGLGGLYYTMDYIKGTWANDGTIGTLGWLAVALVIFATWRSINTIWGSYLFGFLFWVYLVIPNLGRRDIELYKMLPYLVTILVLIVTSLRKRRENQPPASLGLPYFREER